MNTGNELTVITQQQIERSTSSQQEAWQDFVVTKAKYLQERKYLDELFAAQADLSKKIAHQQSVVSSARKAHEQAEGKLTV